MMADQLGDKLKLFRCAVIRQDLADQDRSINAVGLNPLGDVVKIARHCQLLITAVVIRNEQFPQLDGDFRHPLPMVVDKAYFPLLMGPAIRQVLVCQCSDRFHIHCGPPPQSIQGRTGMLWLARYAFSSLTE